MIFHKKHATMIETIVRVFFLTFLMTAIVTYRKIWFDGNYFTNWMKTWLMVAVIAYIFMCFIIRPLVLNKFKLEWKKRHLVGMLWLVLLFAFIFSYRFDTLTVLPILENFWILLLIVLTIGMLIAWPLATKTHKFFIKK